MSVGKIPESRSSQINSFKESGLSIPEWCKENNVKTSTLRYWLNKIKTEENSRSNEEGWVTIAVNNSLETKVSPIVIKVGPFSVEIQPGFDRSTLTEVIAAIHGVC
ncbi:IS66 family insertion sequence element accessory protein TnpA [Desulfosporosinus sp. BICA1-9]|uniref:IS66 family insertion sequence element accessory protein TnpA n=1 Tax=Desulfosporosinus sp. BICA1-9 TaxID=1531958 RepID=UPI00054B02C9|nr:hypothetical protein [Desulfosporosinus sp. BICA1-9]KJS48783.1 MAG: hypothetical protein VR66_12090 [Peptococcaceae bacterium BRH_c23]KJS81693.1 MAG: hypothetical protein JL57_26160 [Desulfosporosinus sp. BICA1-9]